MLRPSVPERAPTSLPHPRRPCMQLAFTMVMYLYEPSLPEVEGPGDLTPAHLEWVEDYLMGALLENGCGVRQVAWLDELQAPAAAGA